MLHFSFVLSNIFGLEVSDKIDSNRIKVLIEYLTGPIFIVPLILLLTFLAVIALPIKDKNIYTIFTKKDITVINNATGFYAILNGETYSLVDDKAHSVKILPKSSFEKSQYTILQDLGGNEVVAVDWYTKSIETGFFKRHFEKGKWYLEFYYRDGHNDFMNDFEER